MLPLLPVLGAIAGVLILGAIIDDANEYARTRTQEEVNNYVLNLKKNKQDAHAKLQKMKHKLHPKVQAAIELYPSKLA